MKPIRRIGWIMMTMGLVAGACSSDGAESTTTAAAPTTSTAITTTTSTTEPVRPTETIAYTAFEVHLEGDPEAEAAVAALYEWLGDRTLGDPDVPAALLDHLTSICETGSLQNWSSMNGGLLRPFGIV